MAEAPALSASKGNVSGSESQRAARRKRISTLWSWALQRRLAELSAQVEAAVIEVSLISLFLLETQVLRWGICETLESCIN